MPIFVKPEMPGENKPPENSTKTTFIKPSSVVSNSNPSLEDLSENRRIEKPRQKYRYSCEEVCGMQGPCGNKYCSNHPNYRKKDRKKAGKRHE